MVQLMLPGIRRGRGAARRAPDQRSRESSRSDIEDSDFDVDSSAAVGEELEEDFRVGPDPVSVPSMRAAAALRAGTRAAVIAALIAGPALGAAAWVRAAEHGHSGVFAAAAAAPAAGPGMFAAAYVQQWLTAGLTQDGTASTDLSVWGPPAQLTAPAGSHQVQWAQLARAEQVTPGYWSVLVTAEVSDVVRNRPGPPVLRWYAVPVLARGPAAAGGSDPAGSPVAYTATALPHQVAVPIALDQPALAVDQTLSTTGTALADTVTSFLQTWWTGADVSRLTSPGTQLSPITGSGVVSVQLTALSGDAAAAAAANLPVPAGTVTIHVLATAATVERSGPGNPTTTELTLVSRAGRWEVHSVDTAPPLDPTEPLPSAQPAASGDPSGSG